MYLSGNIIKQQEYIVHVIFFFYSLFSFNYIYEYQLIINNQIYLKFWYMICLAIKYYLVKKKTCILHNIFF